MALRTTAAALNAGFASHPTAAGAMAHRPAAVLSGRQAGNHSAWWMNAAPSRPGDKLVLSPR
jgi:hypothetical protein